MATVRPPAVAGMFYPDDPAELKIQVDRYLAEAGDDHPPPKALIAPHAGYIYSGPVAASAYAALRPLRGRIRRVVLLGPAHRVPLRGLAAPSAAAFDNPLGRVAVDQQAVAELARSFPWVSVDDRPHAPEHSLEVQLPFLQEVLGEFQVVPLVVGDASPGEVDAVLEALWGGPETLIVISSDLSHYYDYDTARRLDTAASQAIERLDAAALEPEQACGRIPIQGLLETARRHGLRAETVDLRNSGDTAGPRDQVVGYGAYLFY